MFFGTFCNAFILVIHWKNVLYIEKVWLIKFKNKLIYKPTNICILKSIMLLFQIIILRRFKWNCRKYFNENCQVEMSVLHVLCATNIWVRYLRKKRKKIQWEKNHDRWSRVTHNLHLQLRIASKYSNIT